MTERTYLEGCEPTLNELKAHLRITSEDFDTMLESYLRAATNVAEHHIGKVIARSQFLFSGSSHSIPLESPVLEIQEVLVDGVETDGYSLSGNTLLLSDEVEGEALTVSYTAGLSQVPYDIKAAILLIAAKLFNNPVDSVESLPTASKALLAPYRSWGVEDGK